MLRTLFSGFIAERGRWLAQLTEHYVLFPAMAVLVLAIIWSTTAHMVSVEHATAERAATASTLELLDTYEAQMVRNLREIDQALKTVKYAYESTRKATVLLDLKNKELLPAGLLFVIGITDANGHVLASTRPAQNSEFVVEDYAQHLRTSGLWISPPRQSVRTGDWKLEFTRRLNTPDGAFAGVVTILVDAAYFVSGYEREKLGDYGVLGLVGQDGAFRVRRSGEKVSSGDALYQPAFSGSLNADEASVTRAASTWDGVVRFTSVRPLFAFPLTLLVGLSEDEQLAPVRANTRSYIWQAALASAVLILFIAALGRVSWKLAQAARRESEARLEHAERVQFLAYRDALTGLPNRAFFSTMLEQGIAHARRYQSALAVLFLDLDRFKRINDTLGHLGGDRLLQEVAARLQSCLRDSDTVARLGGDEFVVLLPSFEEEKYVATVAQKLLTVIARPFAVMGQNLIGTTSIGIALFPRDGEDEQTLMKHADTAMYHAKAEGKNNFQFYSKSLQVNSLKRLKLENELRQALQRKQFELHYQPKVDLLTNRVTGMEALLRWRSPDLGHVAPADFIPIAEDTGLIVPIGKWALETACEQSVAWHKRGMQQVCMAVNLSARQFNDEHLLDDVTAILNSTGMDPHFLELEITESMLMLNVEKAVRTLKALCEMGLRIAMDEFGTGYSSLSNLKRFPLHTLKIDRTFISALPDDVEDRAITQAIIGMGKALNLTVIAEGVETPEQAEFLRAHGCDEYQGHHFSRPVPAEELFILVRSEPLMKRALPRLTDSTMQATPVLR